MIPTRQWEWVPRFLPEMEEVTGRTGVTNIEGVPLDAGTLPCIACGEFGWRDLGSGLCRPCWRVGVLGPAMVKR